MKAKVLKTRLLPALMLVVTLVLSFPAQAQVTIGEDEKSVEGALLQLKDRTKAEVTPENANATKGLAFPRVLLSQRDKLFPMFEGDTDYQNDPGEANREHTGLVVYNMYVSPESEADPGKTFKEGFYYWDGEKWMEWGTGGGGTGGDTDDCTGPVTANFDSSGDAVEMVNAVNVAGLLGAATTVAVGVGGAVTSTKVNVAGIDLVTIPGDPDECQPFEATGDGWLSNINVAFNVTDSYVGANIIRVNFTIDAALYEETENSGEFRAVANTTIPLKMIDDAPLLGGDLLDNENLSGTPLNFTAEDNIKITAGKRYIVVVSLTAEGLVSLLANVTGTLTGSMTIECNDGGAVVADHWVVSGSTNQASMYTDNVYQKGQVTIGEDVVEPSAALNVYAGDTPGAQKGVLLPQVELSGAKDKVTIPDPVEGLMVYNLGTNPAFRTPGYMYWDGEQWKIFNNSISEDARAVLNCGGTQISPLQQIQGEEAIITGTVLQIPYSTGNGGVFNGATLESVNNANVKATISGGMLAVGNGVLSFSLSGTPVTGQEAPNGIVFDLTPFLSANLGITGCDEVVFGDVLEASITETAVMGYLKLGSDGYYAVQCDSPDGQFSARVSIPGSNDVINHGDNFINVQIRNNRNTSVPIIFNYLTTYGGSISSAGILTVPSNQWGGDENSGTTWHAATGEDDGDGFMGQKGIYDADNDGPEYRRYTWIPQGETNTVAYEITVMAAIDNMDPDSNVPPTQVKAYIKFNQVTAAQ